MPGERTAEFITRAGRMIRESGFGAMNAHQVGVLVFDADTFASDVPAAADLLDRRERTRAARFRFQRDRAIYTVAHAIWRIAIGHCLGVPPHEVSLAFTAEGQPRLPGHAFATSLSHSGNMVAISVAAAETVGVDIEQVPAKVDLEALVPMFCTQREIADVFGLPWDWRAKRLLELWTRKEALLKAFGVGFRTDPATTPAPPHEVLWPPPDAQHLPACHTRNLGNGEGWIAAVASPAIIHDAQLHVM